MRHVHVVCPAAVPEARLMADEDLARAEGVPIGAPRRRRARDPLSGRGLYELASTVNSLCAGAVAETEQVVGYS